MRRLAAAACVAVSFVGLVSIAQPVRAQAVDFDLDNRSSAG